MSGRLNAFAATSIVVLASGCGDAARELAWEAVFGAGADRGRAARVETRIVSDGCGGGTVHFSAVAMPTAPQMPGAVTLPPGTYGFEALAVDAECIVYASGCEERELPLTEAERIRVVMESLTPGTRLCSVERCAAGTCDFDPADAGSVDAGPDGGAPPRTCSREDVVAQVECGPGEHCLPAGDPGALEYLCVESGDGQQTDVCTSHTDCASGFACAYVRLDALPPALCLKTCLTAADCPAAPGTTCMPQGRDFGFCSTDCDPTMTGVCPTGTKCDVYDLMGHTVCLGAGSRAPGDACTDRDQCMPGSVCYNDGLTTRCRQYCVMSRGGCPAGTACTRFSAATTLGLCLSF